MNVCKKDIFTQKIECKKGHFEVHKHLKMPFFTLNFLGEKYTTPDLHVFTLKFLSLKKLFFPP